MKAIQIRNVPDDTHAVLQRRAEAAGQSMQEYLLALLAEHAARPTMEEWLNEVERDRRAGRSDVTADDIVAIIRAARDTR